MYQFNEGKMDEGNTVNLVSSILRMTFKIQFCYFSLRTQGSSGSEEEQQRVVAKIEPFLCSHFTFFLSV